MGKKILHMFGMNKIVFFCVSELYCGEAVSLQTGGRTIKSAKVEITRTVIALSSLPDATSVLTRRHKKLCCCSKKYQLQSF